MNTRCLVLLVVAFGCYAYDSNNGRPDLVNQLLKLSKGDSQTALTLKDVLENLNTRENHVRGDSKPEDGRSKFAERGDSHTALTLKDVLKNLNTRANHVWGDSKPESGRSKVAERGDSQPALSLKDALKNLITRENHVRGDSKPEGGPSKVAERDFSDVVANLQATFNQLLEQYSPIPKASNTNANKKASKATADMKGVLSDALGDVKVAMDVVVKKDTNVSVFQLAKLLMARDTLQKETKSFLEGLNLKAPERNWMDSVMGGLQSGIDVIIQTVTGGPDARKTMQKNRVKLVNMKRSIQVLGKYLGEKSWHQDLLNLIDDLIDSIPMPKSTKKAGFLKEFTALFGDSVKAALSFPSGDKAKDLETAQRQMFKLIKAKLSLQKVMKSRTSSGAMDSLVDGFRGGIQALAELFGGEGHLQKEKLIKLKKSFGVLKKAYQGKNVDIPSVDEVMGWIQNLVDSTLANQG